MTAEQFLKLQDITCYGSPGFSTDFTYCQMPVWRLVKLLTDWEAHQLAEREAQVEQLVGDVRAVSRDYTETIQKLRASELREQRLREALQGIQTLAATSSEPARSVVREIFERIRLALNEEPQN